MQLLFENSLDSNSTNELFIFNTNTTPMKKISQINWKRYKESESGKEAIALFDKVCDPECTIEEVYTIAKRFNPEFFRNESKEETQRSIESFAYFNKLLYNNLTEENVPQTGEEAFNFFLFLSHFLATEDEEVSIDDIPQANFKAILSSSTFVSMMLYAYIPTFFIPNLFVMQFIYLKKFAEKYDLELPKIPNRSNYKDRWFYYFDLCIVLNNFAVENKFESAAELCAFLYDFELPMIKEEIENESDVAIPETPGQAWIIVGNYGKGEKNMKYGFWQANELTEKGDILLFYEKSPVKALNSVWIAQQDGTVDPFFYYYSNTYIGNKISIPDNQAVKYEDFKKSKYFANREKKGNFVSKNFQDVSGWSVNSEDYKEIKRILESKGFDTSVLPKLYEPAKIGEIAVEVEKDVSEKLLIPLLEQMGWVKDVDFKGEVEFNAGRTKTNHSSDKRPDFCLHIVEKNDDIEAKVAIEVKKHMKTQKEIHDSFVQGRSYAKWGAVKILVLVDMRQILVYERDRNNQFNENRPIKFSWSDMENPDKYAELKRLLS